LRRPSFRAALASIRNTMRFRADIELAQAAAFATSALTQLSLTPQSDDTADCPLPTADSKQTEFAISLLRLSHIRQRFIDDAKDLPVVCTDNSLFHSLRKINPDMPLGDALDYLAMRLPQFRLADAELKEDTNDDEN
jgi:hypothetical protein